jgi:hypothetical protein
MAMRSPIPALAALVLLAGCAAPGGDYPSLLPRPIEQGSFAEPDRETAQAEVDSALEVRIEEHRTALAVATARFDTAAIAAERLAAAARGASAGSEAWLDAQVALAELDTLRNDGATLLGDIEQLAINRALEGKPAYPPLARLQREAEERARVESKRIAELSAMLVPA